jgi:hypothetical protein
MQSPRRQLIDLDLDSSNVYSFDHIENGLVTDSSELFQLNLQKQPLSWLYKSILGKFPEFRFGGSSTTPEDELKHKAALMVTSQAKGKGLQ